MAFCVACGSQQLNGARFCSSCGAGVSDEFTPTAGRAAAPVDALASASASGMPRRRAMRACSESAIGAVISELTWNRRWMTTF
jgi:hypothetical protein